MAKPSTQPSKSSVEIGAINVGLRGPVIDAIKRCVPELSDFSRDELFERVMNTPDLAALCFKVFRTRSSQFEAVLVGPDGQTIVNDNEPLQCGRSLAEVIAMIVRAVARRYLRAKLDGKSGPQFIAPGAHHGIIHRAAEFLGLEARPAAAASGAREERGQSAGDRAYRALYDYLLFEWQVSLIPEYASIPLETISDIGPYLYAARDAAAVRALMVTKTRPSASAGSAPADSRPAGPSDSRNW